MKKCTILFVLLLLFALSTSAGAAKSKVEARYLEVREAYLEFLKKGKPKHKARRDVWMKHIDAFAAIQKKYPKHKRADDALYWMADAYQNIYEVSRVKKDLRTAITYYRKLIDLYPKSNLADDAAFYIGRIYEEKLKQPKNAWKAYDKCSRLPNGDMATKAIACKMKLGKYAPAPTPVPTPEPTPEPTLVQTPESMIQKGLTTPTHALPTHTAPKNLTGDATVEKVDVWSNPDYTRIVVYADREASFRTNLLPADPDHNKPRRLVVDLEDSVLGSSLNQNIPIGDGLLKGVRAGQFKEDTVRIVLDIQSIRTHRIIPMFDPFRLVIDVTGERKEQPAPKYPVIRKIVIDAGHGGKDPGAIGRGTKEKTLTLLYVKMVSKRLRAMGFKVIMTRKNDRYIPLEGRTAIANKMGADLFISIHINASRRRSASGIETFHFSPRASKEDMALVAAENMTARAKVEQIDRIYQGLALGYKKMESNELAASVQSNILARLTPYRGTINRGVKSAPFYVLMGANMPAILIECGFITNKKDRKRLLYGKYQRRIADGIAKGVAEYVKGLNPDWKPKKSGSLQTVPAVQGESVQNELSGRSTETLLDPQGIERIGEP